MIAEKSPFHSQRGSECETAVYTNYGSCCKLSPSAVSVEANASNCVCNIDRCAFRASCCGKESTTRSVTPVVANGVEYSADGDGRNGCMVVMDVASGRETCWLQ